MHTKTSKAVIAPLAEAVSSLVLIISDAEINRTPMPDLTALVKVVDDQIGHLTAVALRISSQATVSDTQLKLEMPESCTRVKKSSEVLLAGAAVLVQDPHSPAGRNDLLEGVKGILRNTSSILSVMDDLEIRRLLTAMSQIRTHLNGLRDQEVALSEATQPAMLAKLEQPWVAAVASFSQSFITFLQQCHKRAVEIIDQSLQMRLENAISLLTRESPILISTCRVVITRLGPSHSKMLLTSTIQRMQSACDEIELVLRTRPDDEISSELATEDGRVRTVQDVIGDIKYHVASKTGISQSLITDYTNITNAIYNGTKRVMNLVTEPAQRSAIQSEIETILKTDVEAVSAMKTIIQRPESVQAQQDLTRSLMTSTNAHTVLKFIRNRALVAQLTASIVLLRDPFNSGTYTLSGAVWDAATRGNKARLPGCLQAFEGECARWVALCGCVLELCPISNKRLALEARQCIRRVEVLMPLISASAQVVVLSPQDATAAAHFEKVGRLWVEMLHDTSVIGRECFSSFEIVSGTQHCFSLHSDAFSEAMARNDLDGALMHTVCSFESAKQLANSTRRICNSTFEPIYKASLEARLFEMEKVMPSYASRVVQILDTKRITDLPELQTSIKEVGTRFGAIEDLMRIRNEAVLNLNNVDSLKESETRELTVEGVSVQILEQANDSVMVDDVQPRPLPEAEAKADPIQAAAQEIKVEASYWSAKDNPIVDAAAKIAEHLFQLGKHHRNLSSDASSTTVATAASAENKKGFINAAKALHTEALKIVAAAKPIAERCSDPQLQRQLHGSLQWIENLAQQLKIVAAVKTSAPLDTDRDAQLVACARNVMTAVRNCIRDSEAGSLRAGGAGEAAAVTAAAATVGAVGAGLGIGEGMAGTSPPRNASVISVPATSRRPSYAQAGLGAPVQAAAGSHRGSFLKKKEAPVQPAIKFRRNIFRKTTGVTR
ncbi:Vinculin family-domain-containing protein [Chytriomyces sp. MP71]|nr:Vinculin family-domain-containing protein [Chytriomyces sp. MP71]